MNKLILALVLLLSFGILAQENENNTPAKPSVEIFAAAATGNLEQIKLHIAAGTYLNAKEPMKGSSPLITSIVFNHTDVANELIKAGADINQKNNEGSTPLITATVFCRVDIVKELLEKGADKSITNPDGKTALQIAQVPFKYIKPVYDQLAKGLAPIGVKFDYDYIEKTRPIIADMLKESN